MVNTGATAENDLLSLTKDKSIKAFTRDELIEFSSTIDKINRYGMSQERIMIVTDKAIYNLKKRSLKRRIAISSIRGISLSKFSNEFVIHCNDLEYDYQYISERKKKIIELVAKYYYIEKSSELKLYELETRSLSTFVTTKKEKQKDINFSRMPNTGITSVSAYVYGVKGQNIVSKKAPLLMKTGKIYDSNVCLNDFNLIKTIGRGSCAKIYLAEYKKTGDLYAIKSVRKDQLLSENLIQNILLEKNILESSECPFLLCLSFFFQTPERMYMVMPYVPGGDLFHWLKEKKNFEEEEVKIFAAQIALALEHLHSYGVVYRDLKPENILIEENGYIKLCDFGAVIHIQSEDKIRNFGGSPEYVSPEVITGEGHNSTADWWQLGILIYELLFGIPPFYHLNQDRMFEFIQLEEVKFPKNKKASNEVMDIIIKLLNKNPNTRLGRGGLSEIKTHPFFGTLNFELLKDKKLLPPFKPKLEDRTDTSNFDPEFVKMPTSESPISKWVYEYQDWFNEFDKTE